MSGQAFDLQFPFEYKGANYSKLELRRPKVRDLKKFVKELDKDSIGAMEKAIADLAEIDEKIIAEIDLEDFAPVKEWFEGFLKKMLDASTAS